MLNARKLTKSHYEEVASLRLLVNHMAKYVEQEMIFPVINNSLKNDNISSQVAVLWGGKEDALSVLTKLTALLLKLIPLEQELLERYGTYNKPKVTRKCKTISTTQYSLPFTQEDEEILRYYKEKVANEVIST